MTTALEQHTVLPPDEDADGGSALEQLRSALSLPNDQQAKLVAPDGTEVALPAQVYGVLRDVANALSQGLAITVAPHATQLTTQQAADLLNISRPTLVRLLEEGEIPYEQPGRHRKVRLSDALAYQERSRSERRAALSELARADSEDGTAEAITEFVETR